MDERIKIWNLPGSSEIVWCLSACFLATQSDVTCQGALYVTWCQVCCALRFYRIEFNAPLSPLVANVLLAVTNGARTITWVLETVPTNMAEAVKQLMIHAAKVCTLSAVRKLCLRYLVILLDRISLSLCLQEISCQAHWPCRHGRMQHLQKCHNATSWLSAPLCPEHFLHVELYCGN